MEKGIKNNNTEILVVEDSTAQAEQLQSILKPHGYSVSLASNGLEAIKIMALRKPAVVISDIVMPEMDGYQFCRWIKHNENFKDIPVILLTVLSDSKDVLRGLKCGADNFITKPYNEKYLLSRIHYILENTELRKSKKTEAGVEISLGGENFFIVAERQQILDLLLSAYEAAIQKNLELAKTRDELETINAELTELNREMDALVAERTISLMALTVADRVRNPASVIGGVCKRIIKKENIPADMTKGLKDIIEEAEKLEHIVKDFEVLLKSKQSVFRYQDINEIINETIFIIEKEKEVVNKGLSLSVQLTGEPLKINAHKNLLRSAIFNLLRNAVEATPQGGKITVKTFIEEDKAVLTVTDTGAGILAEDINRIFDPFFSTKGHRFGMGLPLVKQIVLEHLGEIKIESEPGKGTTFKIIFPLRWKEAKLSH